DVKNIEILGRNHVKIYRVCQKCYLCATNCANFNIFMQKDQYQHPDYYLVDELLTDEQKLIRDTVRAYVKKEISPIIEDYAQKATFPKQIIKGLGELGCFGPFVPQEYGGAGLDYITY